MTDYTYYVKYNRKKGTWTAKVREFPLLATHGNSYKEAFDKITNLVEDTENEFKNENQKRSLT